MTQGRYGYVDPTGEAREYSYTSGIRCDPDTREVRPELQNNAILATESALCLYQLSQSPAEIHSVAAMSRQA